MLFMGNVNAQGFYAEISGGYGWGLGENQLGMESFTDVSLQNGAPVQGDGSYDRAINGTIGTGLNITVAPGFMFTKYVGVELGINYFKGSETVISENSNPETENFGYSKTTAQSNQVRLLPTLVLNTGGDKLYGFAKVGLVLPVTGSTKGLVEASQYQTFPGGAMVKIDAETKSTGKFSLGFRGSVGVGYQISDLISVNLEGFYTALHVKAKHRVVESKVAGGADQLVGVPTYYTEVNYVDELNGSSNNDLYINDMSDLDTDSPKEEIMAPTNFSQLGFQIGLKFSF